MDWASYKRLCDQPNYWSRWMLEESKQLFDAAGANDIAQQLADALGKPPLPLPDGHNGSPLAQMFVLDMPSGQRARAADLMAHLVARKVRTARTAERGLGGFAEAWQEFAARRGEDTDV